MLATVREAWKPLRSQWLGEVVLLSAEDRVMRGMALRKGVISTPMWESMLPAQALDNGMPALVDVLGDFIGDMLLSQALIGQAVRVALPVQAAHWRVIDWPFDSWPDEPIEALRTIDPDLGMPFALADAAIDLQPLPGRPLRSLLVAAPRALVDAWSMVFEIAGAPLERLLPTQVCLRLALQSRLQSLDPRDGAMLLHPSGSGCIASLWHQGVPLYERLLMADDPEFVSQLQQIVAFYCRHDPGFSLRHLWLSEDLPKQDHLGEALGCPLERLDPAPYESLVMQGLAQAR